MVTRFGEGWHTGDLTDAPGTCGLVLHTPSLLLCDMVWYCWLAGSAAAAPAPAAAAPST
jgi:hypothetical protein